MPKDISNLLGHIGSTIKIQFMKKLSKLHFEQTDCQERKNKISLYNTLIKECDDNKNNILTSTLHESSKEYINSKFYFFDNEKNQMHKIPAMTQKPLIIKFNILKTELMQKIELCPTENLLEFPEFDCAPQLVCNNKTVLSICIEKDYNSFAKKLIDKYEERCLMDLNYKGKIELITAFKRNGLIAYYLIEKFGLRYAPYRDLFNYNLLMESIWCLCPIATSKIIEIFGLDCEPGHLSDSRNTALIIAGAKKQEHIAILLLDKFGLDACLVDHKNNEGNTIETLANKYNMKKLIEKIKDLRQAKIVNDTVNNNEVVSSNTNTNNIVIGSVHNVSSNIVIGPNLACTVSDEVKIIYKGHEITNLFEACTLYQSACVNNEPTNILINIVHFFTQKN